MQRMRVLHALGEIASEEGLQSATVERVASLACVSQGTFRELFGDRQAALEQGWQEAVARASARIGEACRAAGSSSEQQVRAGVAALLGFLEDEPELAALAIVQAWERQGRRESMRELVSPMMDVITAPRAPGESGAPGRALAVA
jgi:AcrR family transcriptional regulator